MSETTPRLALPLVAANQAQKHVPVNEALTRLDAVVQLAVIARDLAEPPADPQDGDCYIVAPDAAGIWTGRENTIASYATGWSFAAPAEGWLAWDRGAQELIVFTDDEWTMVTAGATGGTSLQNIPLLGVGTEADETNPFSAKLNGALWTALEAGDGGSGDLRYVMNKESAPNVLSLLMQSAYSGRAEIGLIGDNDLLLKVSADGILWRDALRIDHASGRVSFPSGGAREQLAADRTYYVRADGNDANDGLENSSGGAFATLQRAMDVAYGEIDIGPYDVTIQIGDGTYEQSFAILAPQVGSGKIKLRGNAAAPDSTVISGASGVQTVSVSGGAALYLEYLEIAGNSAVAVSARKGGQIFVGAGVRIGAAVTAQLQALEGGMLDLSTAVISIVGDCSRCIRAAIGGVVYGFGAQIDLAGRTFSTAVIEVGTGGVASLNSAIWSGSPAGKKYDVTGNGALASNVSIPGTIAGTTATGGQYL